MKPVYVVGHLNPDTDAIASALGYAWLLHTRDDINTIAARAGVINKQTEWLLSEAGLTSPELLTDAAPKFDQIARRIKPLLPTQTIRVAWAGATTNRVSAPVVDAEGVPLGFFHGESLFAWLAHQLANQDLAEDITVGDLLDRPCGEMLETDAPRFPISMRIRDARLRMLHEERRDFWVVRDSGAYFGLARKSDILNPPRMQLILVDHNEPSQSVSSLNEAEVLEVLDHHRLGNSHTRAPITFNVDIVGSTSTLVAERIIAADLRPPSTIALILLAGLLSDTLVMRSPTTTPRDHRVAEILAGWAELSDWRSFGTRLIRAGAGLAAREISMAVTSDLKLYETGDIKFGIAQIEVGHMAELDEHRRALSIALEQLCATHNLGLAVLMVTDVVEGGSRLMLFGEEAQRLADLPYMHLPDGTLDAPGVVSRKKQLLPNILALLAGD